MDTAMEIESMEIISKALITVNLGVKEENTLSLFNICVVDIVKEWQSTLKFTAQNIVSLPVLLYVYDQIIITNRRLFIKRDI